MEDLAYKIGQTNLGKYAGDFGIDINRLAGDLIRYGGEGEYATMVQDRLNDTIGTGFSVAAKGLASGLNPMTTQFEKANIAQTAFEQLLRTNADIIGQGADAAGNAAGANEGYASATEQAAAAAERAKQQINELANQMRAQTEAAVGAFDAQTAWGAAVDAAQDQADGAASGLNVYTEAGRANRTMLSNLAGAWNAQPPAVKNSMKEYKNARQTFLAVADGMDVPRKRAMQLADSLLDIPRKTVAQILVEGQRKALADSIGLGIALGALGGLSVRPSVNLEGATGAIRTGVNIGSMIGNLDRRRAKPKITADGIGANRTMNQVGTGLTVLGGRTATPGIKAIDNASGVIDGVRAGLAGIQSKSITITTFKETIDLGVRLGGGAGVNRAAGGPVFGPGTATSDSIPAWLSNGEFVVKSAAVKHYGLGTLFDLNAMRLAGGGSSNGERDRGGLSGSLSGGGGSGRIPSGPFGEWLREQREASREAKAERRALLRMIERTTPGDQSKKELKRLADKFDEFRTERREQARARKQAIRDFAPEAGGEESDLLRSLREFERGLEKAGGIFTEQMRRQGERLVDVNAKFRDLVEQLDGENGARRALEDMTQAASDFRSSVGQSINGDIFGNGLAGLELQLAADANDNASIEAAFRAAVGKELDAESDFAKALFASGDLNTAQQLAGLDAAGIDRYEALYANRASNQASLANFAGQASFGAPIAAQTAAVASLQASIDQLGAQFKDIEKRMEAGVAAGAQKGTLQGTYQGSREGLRDYDRAKTRYTSALVAIGPRRRG